MMDVWEKGLPRYVFIGLVSTVALVGVLIFASVKLGFDSYYDAMQASAVERQLTTYDDLAARAAAEGQWEQRLGQGRMPIDRAMEQLATRGRAAFPAIRPQKGAEMNTDPLAGWNQLPQELGLPEPEPEPVVPAPFFDPNDELSPGALEGLEGAE